MRAHVRYLSSIFLYGMNMKLCISLNTNMLCLSHNQTFEPVPTKASSNMTFCEYLIRFTVGNCQNRKF